MIKSKSRFYARPFFSTKEKLRVGMPHSNFCTVPSGAVSTYESKFILYIEKYTYVRIHISRPLPLGESSPNNKVRKKWVFLKLIFIPTYYYVCKNIISFFPNTTKKYLATNSARLLRGILGLLFPHGNGRFIESIFAVLLKVTNIIAAWVLRRGFFYAAWKSCINLSSTGK